MKKEVRLSFLISKFFVFSLNAIVIIALIKMNPSNFQNFEFFNIILFLINVVTLYLFCTIYKNPGYIQKENDDTQYDPPIPLSMIKIQDSISILKYPPQIVKYQHFEEKKNEIKTSEITNNNLIDMKLSKIKNSVFSEEIESNYTDDVNFEQSFSEESQRIYGDKGIKKNFKIILKHYCNKCEIEQEYRTKHCNRCEKCILKYDHHCFWIGGCIGELNHGKYCIFLFLITFEIFYFLIKIFILILNFNCNNCNDDEYMLITFLFLLIVILIFCVIFTTGLFSYHCYLITTNQTTWEHQKRNEIDYLKIYPNGFYPFNQGFWNNFKMIFYHNQIKTWELPNLDEAKIKMETQFNIFENKYYSLFKIKEKK